MQTKAELEAEIARLRLRVAELEGAVSAYEYAIAHHTPLPSDNLNNPNWWWQPQVFNTQPGVLPTITAVS